MRIPDSVAVPVVTGALLALAAWVYSTGNRVAALEARQPTIEENLNVIREDVRQIRDWVVPETVALPGHK
jgi:cbb3-type cytochrome oxidase subunit 3